ncbi:hypothetical protein K466DRAFT_465818, partial [Polyporus arcularius HHB13444]
RAQAWTKTAEIIKAYTDEQVAKLNSELDTLLVYAGLFSAIVTAFNVQSYQLLQPPQPDPTPGILERISTQLGNLSETTHLINSTQSSYNPSSVTSQGPTRAVVWVNILWFSALIFSLASASIGIMVKQWLRELSTDLQGTSREIAQTRQYRVQNTQKWKLREIASALPVLLHLSLTCFLSGLLILLWTLHVAVAAVSSALVGLLLTFIVATTILPVMVPSCCYHSP